MTSMSVISVEHAKNLIKRIIGCNDERQKIFDSICNRTCTLGEATYKNVLGIILNVHYEKLHEEMNREMDTPSNEDIKYERGKGKLQKLYDQLVGSDYVEYVSDIKFRDPEDLKKCRHNRIRFHCQRDYERLSNILFTEQQTDLLRYESVRINLKWLKREYPYLLGKNLDDYCRPIFKPTIDPDDPEFDTDPEPKRGGRPESVWIKDFQKIAVDLFKNNGWTLTKSLETVRDILESVYGKCEQLSATEKRQERMKEFEDSPK